MSAGYPWCEALGTSAPEVKRGWTDGRRGGPLGATGLLGSIAFTRATVMILLNSIVTFEPRPDCGHSPSDAWKLRWSWFGKSLSVSFLNKGLRLIHLLLDLGCKENINLNGNLEQRFRN